MAKKKTYGKQLVFCVLWIAGIVAFDQLVKLYAINVVSNAPGGTLPFIPGFISLRYMENTGAAFSIFSGATWILGVLSAVLAALIIWILYRYRAEMSTFGRLSLCFIAGGAIGNVIDRLSRGYVVDMLDFDFVRFAVFNVADSFVCIGAVMFCIYMLFMNRSEKKDEREKTDHV